MTDKEKALLEYVLGLGPCSIDDPNVLGLSREVHAERLDALLPGFMLEAEQAHRRNQEARRAWNKYADALAKAGILEDSIKKWGDR